MSAQLSTHGYQQLLELQRRIHEYTGAAAQEIGAPFGCNHAPLFIGTQQYLALAPLMGGLRVEFYGAIFDEPLQWTLDCLRQQAVADTLVSLSFSGPDEGANGTREWEFSSLLDSDVRFSALRSLAISPTEPQHHNASLIQRADSIMEEGGEIARFCAKAPHLTELVVPNAPNNDFFQVPLPQLSTLRIGGNFDTQHFIDNLANSSNLPHLSLLDFTESTELQSTWASVRSADLVTGFSSYEKLFASPVFDSVRVLILRNSCLTLEQLQALNQLRPELQFQVVQATQGGYVSHFARDVFPWRHLVQADPGLR